MGKHKLKIMAFIISRVKQKFIQFPKHGRSQLWENTNIAKVWVSYIFCLTYFLGNINICNSENMEKVNSHSNGNVWENTFIPKSWVSSILHV